MKRKKSLLREYAETIIYAFIIAMVVRTFVVQAFKIPTGSMEPTLHGHPRHGDRIFVNKFIYRFKPPERGDVIVFATKNIPGLDRHKDYIKRLVGLPGETVQIKNDSVYIDGEIATHSIIGQNTYFNSSPVLKSMDLPKKKFRIPKFFFLVWAPDKGNFFLLNSIIYKLPAGTNPGDIFTFDPRNIEYMEGLVPFKTSLIACENQLVEFLDDGIYVDKTKYIGNYILNQLYVIQGQYGMDGHTLKIPENSYFALGDNSANSKDSRYWGVVPKENLKGKAMFIWWPPKRWQLVK